MKAASTRSVKAVLELGHLVGVRISGHPWLRASSKASRQKSASRGAAETIEVGADGHVLHPTNSAMHIAWSTRRSTVGRSRSMNLGANAITARPLPSGIGPEY